MSRIICLIGPIGVGKSTIASHLADITDANIYSIDDLQWKYFTQLGYDPIKERSKIQDEGFLGILRYREPFRLYTLRLLLELHRNENCIFDFGGGFTVFENKTRLVMMKSLLSKCITILLKPFPAIQKSVELLDSRIDIDAELISKVNEYVLKHKSNQELADHVVYTYEDPIDIITNRILAKIGYHII